MARQPEIAGNIQTAMIIAAALIEGVTFFALIIILLQVSSRLTSGIRRRSVGQRSPGRLPRSLSGSTSRGAGSGE